MDQVTHSFDLSGIPSSVLARELSCRAWRQGRPSRIVLRPCEFCTLPFGARGMRVHRKICVKNPRRLREAMREASKGTNGQ